MRDSGQALGEQLGLVFDFPDDLEAVYRQFGIDLSSVNGEDRFALPMPARFLVDNDGMIRDAAVNPDYTRRPEPGDMVELLRMLA